MSEVIFSKEQLEAIHQSGQNILVSASAGSGKTTVLIERIMTKLRLGMNIDEMLIVTFTEASAKDMKRKLRNALTKALNKENNPHLRKQLMLLPNAYISTFHAFCNRVIKKYFYLIAAESKYSIVSDVELFMIRDEVLETLFQKLYEVGDPDFIVLVDRFTSSRSDQALKIIVNRLYDQLRNIPFKEQEMARYIDLNRPINSLAEFAFIDDIYQLFLAYLDQAENCFRSAYKIADDPSVGHRYVGIYPEDQKIIDTLRTGIIAKDYQQLYQTFVNLSFKQFNSKALDSCLESTKEQIKALREQGKDTIVKKISPFFRFSEESQIKFICSNGVILKALFKLIHQFEESFKKAKAERGQVDFGDLEEMTLKIFSLSNFDNEATNYYRHQFQEILIDEYQDTNSMQETIIQAIARGNNVFTVGDVKQSIYRFRNADPEIFQTKYHSFAANQDQGLLINLNANYRSRFEVLDFINFVFAQIMDQEVGGIDYDDAAALKLGFKDYPEIATDFVELSIIKKENVLESSEEDYSKIELEAHYVAQKIRALIERQELVYDQKTKELRPITLRDIVILSRSAKTEQPIFSDVFKRYDIPLLTSDLRGYFDSIEVLTVLSFLEIIDNPLQDIPFVAVLRSAFAHINEKELAEIKAHSKGQKGRAHYFYDHVKRYIESGPNQDLVTKLQRFLNLMDQYRERVKNESLTDVLFSLYHDTNYYDYVKGQLGGLQRQANLDLLYERSKEFQDLAANSLYKFINFIKFLRDKEEDLEQARTMSDHEDLVQFMTIHKSKGLEFPVVFVVNLSKKYNLSDIKEKVLFDRHLGIAFEYYDEKHRVIYPNLYHAIVKAQLERHSLSEEMRVLYVALTRAKERLYLVGTVNDYAQTLAKYRSLMDYEQVLYPENDRLVQNYLDLILMGLIRHPLLPNPHKPDASIINQLPKAPQLAVKLIDALALNPAEKQKLLLTKPEEDFERIFNERLFYRYPYQERTTHFAKLSISDIKRLETVSEFSFRPGSEHFAIPKFVRESDPMRRGTAYHKFMQHLDYQRDYTLSDLENLRQALVEQEILHIEDAELIDLNIIYRYLEHDFVKDFKRADLIRKELPFTTLIPANTVYPNYPYPDDVLIQGVMDLVIVYPNQVYLIDFKTDRIPNTLEALERIKAQYQSQIDYYRNALGKLYPDKVITAQLYLLQLNRFLEL